MSSSGSSVPEGHVALVLLTEGDSEFYLQIPSDTINSLCLKPLKYLLFLGWCILGVEGVLALEHGGKRIDIDGNLVDQEIYHYVPVGGLDLAHAVDLEVIKVRTNVPSESTQTRDEFRTNLVERDVCCVWTGVGLTFGAGLHIIPYKRGSEWFRLIVENRPSYTENVVTLRDINDIRNGVFANTLIHNGFDPRFAAVLKTPNPILNPKDIPARQNRGDISGDVSFPSRSRYTLQWLVDSEGITSMIPNNSDAAFRKNTRKPKPSDLLLHYNYGAAAVKCWGRGLELLQDSANPPRPAVPVPAPTGPSRTAHDRETAIIRKLHAARDPGGAGAGSSTAGAGTGRLVESEDQGTWDEDDVMLFFWGNSQAAKERHLKKVSENTRRMEQWREGVP